MPTICEYCGKSIESPAAGQVFCSPVCQRKASLAIQRKARAQLRANSPKSSAPRRTEKVCADCGVSFLGYPRSYRCPSCQAEANRQAGLACKARAARGHTRPLGSTDTCVICGAPYTVCSGLQRYCDACAAAQSRKRSAEAARKLRADPEFSAAKKADEAAVRAQAATIERRVCPVCGRLFAPSAAHPRTCSDDCARRALSDQRRAYLDRKRAQAHVTGVPEVIRAARSALGLSRKQLAQALGYRNAATVQQWEQGVCLPPEEKLSDLSSVLHVPIESLRPSSPAEK